MKKAKKLDVGNYSAYIAHYSEVKNGMSIGGYCVHIYSGTGTLIKVLRNCVKDPNISKLELTAAIELLRRISEGSKVLIVSAEKYTINILSGAWKAKKNLDLIVKFLQLIPNKTVEYKLSEITRAKRLRKAYEFVENYCVESLNKSPKRFKKWFNNTSDQYYLDMALAKCEQCHEY